LIFQVHGSGTQAEVVEVVTAVNVQVMDLPAAVEATEELLIMAIVHIQMRLMQQPQAVVLLMLCLIQVVAAAPVVTGQIILANIIQVQAARVLQLYDTQVNHLVQVVQLPQPTATLYTHLLQTGHLSLTDTEG
jgi:hypothetical protein